MSGATSRNRPTSPRAPHRASAAAVSAIRRIVLAALGLILLGLPTTTPASAQQLGDFGRLKPGFLNNEVVPLFDRNRRGTNGKRVDGFNMTDEEIEMRDRVWTFLVAPHAKDWAWPYTAEIRPANAQPDGNNYVGKYYRKLSEQRYASSHARFTTIADDATTDTLALPATFASVCAVIEIDRQRAVAVAEVGGLDRGIIGKQEKRRRDNDAFVERFVLALDFRYQSYGYAVDHFLVETPHQEAIEADAALSELAIWVDRANARDFCGDSWSARGDGEAPLPGRILLDAPDEGSYRK